MVARNENHNKIHYLKSKATEYSGTSFILFSNSRHRKLSNSYRDLFFRMENYFLSINDDIISKEE